MRRITAIGSATPPLSPELRGAVAAIGNFDGVHLGHRAVIDAAHSVAQAKGAPLAVLTFEPHPREVFAPGGPPFRLMSAEARAEALGLLGVDLVLELAFDADLIALDAEAFAREVLAGRLGLGHVVTGADFRFGKGRGGTVEALSAFGARFGFGTGTAPLVSAPDGTVISSSAIRAHLAEGRPREAAALLGDWHRITGPVLHGDKRGRTLGYPTANMALGGLAPPRFGVYAVMVEVLEGPHAGRHPGAASIGVRPMFGVNAPNCESFLLDFSGDLYGARLSVALVEYLRPEMKFDGLPALIAQMGADCDRARAILADV